jgi:hypothetical protein
MLLWRLYRNFIPLPPKYSYTVIQFNEVLELVMAIGFWLFFRGRAKEFAASAGVAPGKSG